MDSSKHKIWKTLLHRVTAKQHSIREQTHSVCLHAEKKYKKVESNDYKTTSKK